MSEEQFNERICFSYLSSLAASIGKYGLLLYGLANIVSEKPDYRAVAFGGLGFAVFTMVDRIAKDFSIETIVRKELNRKIKN